MSSGSEVTRRLDFSSCICDDQNSYFKPEQELFLTPSKFSFCLNLTRPLAQCYHNKKFKN